MSTLTQSLAKNAKSLPAQSNSLAMKMRQKIKIYKNTNILRKIKQEQEQNKQKKKLYRCVEWMEGIKRLVQKRCS